MFYSLLDGEATTPNTPWLSYVLIGVLVVILIVSMVVMNRRSKKRDQEAKDMMNAIRPGNKVKTIGGICGIVVEVNSEEETFVLETGTETSGKSYMKFVLQAILESDAVVEKHDNKAGVKEVEPETVAETEQISEPVEEKEVKEEKSEEKTAQKE